MNTLLALRKEIKKNSDPEKALSLQKYFKTGVGEYGEGDVFLGLTVPVLRKIAKQHKELSLEDIQLLLKSKIHEERSAALMVLGFQFEKAKERWREQIIQFYLTHTRYINNWDLVDESAWMLGQYLLDKDIEILRTLSKSSLLWERRIAMIATHEFSKKGNPKPTYELAEALLTDTHDLMHKAVGWMLREMGSSCGKEILEAFLMGHYKTMPRTALRYALEHFEEEERQNYLKGKI